MTAPGRVARLDLLRGVAVALVIAHHAVPDLLPGAGVVGVVMFFALSGYLITGVLADELRATGTVSLRTFYLRRVARLVPAMVVMLAALSLVTLTIDPLHDRGELGHTLLWALTWTGDLPFGHASDATFHLWTLAMEEQFYLVWPTVLVLAWRRGRVGTALALVGLACALACVATVVWFRADPDLAYALPTSWAGCFVVGAWVRLGPVDRIDPRWAAPALLLLGALSVVPLRGHALTYLAGGPAIAALTGVVVLAWRTRPGPVPASARVLVALGTVSYAAYLWNYPLSLWLARWPALAVVLTLVAAVVSTRHVEEPVLRRQRARRRARRLVTT